VFFRAAVRISCLHHHLHLVWQQKYDILPGYPAHPVDLKPHSSQPAE
jgi:hypothetical protein